jgi:hypothetical protein
MGIIEASEPMHGMHGGGEMQGQLKSLVAIGPQPHSSSAQASLLAH